jgi:hypothetical protein
MNKKIVSSAINGFLLLSILLIVEYFLLAALLFLHEYYQFDYNISKMAISALIGSFMICVLRLIFYTPIALVSLVLLVNKTKITYTPLMLSIINCGLYIGISALHSIFLLPSPELMVSFLFLFSVVATFSSPILIGLFPPFRSLGKKLFNNQP